MYFSWKWNVCHIFIIVYLMSTIYGEYIPPGPKYRCPSKKNPILLNPCTCDLETDKGLFVNCSNSNLAMLSIGLNNLAAFEVPIEKLTIYRCHISRLFGSLLYNLNLRVLSIEQTPIEEIEEFSFSGINTTLQELHLIDTNLIKFPSEALKQMGSLVVLNIDGSRLNEVPNDAFRGSLAAGSIQRLSLANGNLTGVSIETLQPLRKLRFLNLQRNNIQELKRSQFKGLREVEAVDLSFNSLRKLDASHLSDLIKLTFFNVSHNNLTELTRGAFARNTVLRLLNMTANGIKKLDSNVFRGMRFLRRLYLADNEISDVGRGTFDTLSKIGTIDLARNRLKTVDYQMFFQLKFIEIINLSGNQISEIQKLAFKDIYLTDINLSSNNISRIESGAFINCANITKLDLSYNKLKTIPRNAWDETTYATELQLSYNNLTSLNQVSLSNMTGLKVLNASHNAIETIPKNSFPKLYELHTVDLSHNNLSHIFNTVFQTLFSLRVLNVSHNPLENIRPSTFGTLPTLLHLDLSYNQLSDVPRSAFSGLASTRTMNLRGNKFEKLFLLPISVSHLDLSQNQLQDLPLNTWPSMNSLLSLNLSSNKLGDSLTGGSFTNLLTLQTLDLSWNEITQPPWTALADLTSLQYLDLEGNHIDQLNRNAFGRLPVVFELNLAQNRIANVSSRAFEGLLQLLVLNLTHNHIEFIPNGAFQGLAALRTLDLSFNSIEKLDNKTHGLLDDCLSLENLNISHNRISTITRKTFPSDPYYPYKLKNVDLSYNLLPIVTFDFTFGTATAEVLNLSHNSIRSIRPNVIGNLTRLKVLDLSHNQIDDLTSKSNLFNLPNSTERLYLEGNQLQNLPWDHILNATRLQLLDLRYNLFSILNKALIKLYRNGSSVYFEGNPLNCDCSLRPLKRYLITLMERKWWHNSIKCASPPNVANRRLIDIDEESLFCPLDRFRSSTIDPDEYQVTPDLKFRTIQLNKLKKLEVSWYIRKNDDIADSVVVLRDVNRPNINLYEETFPYYQRRVEIDFKKGQFLAGKQLKGKNRTMIEVCLVARDSKGEGRPLFPGQCQIIPEGVLSKGSKLSLFGLDSTGFNVILVLLVVLQQTFLI